MVSHPDDAALDFSFEATYPLSFLPSTQRWSHSKLYA
jgi:hypothetical protein